MKIDISTTSLAYNTPSCSAFIVFTSKPENGTLTARTARTCREEVAGYQSYGMEWLGYAARGPYINGNYKNLDFTRATSFWREIEKRVGLPPCEFIQAENFPTAALLKVDPFWKQNTTRFAFLTLFLRAACVYTGYSNAEEDIFTVMGRYDLAALIMPAVKLFLDGKTTPTYDTLYGRGIVDTFRGKNENDLSTMLVEFIRVPPKEKKPEPAQVEKASAEG